MISSVAEYTLQALGIALRTMIHASSKDLIKLQFQQDLPLALQVLFPAVQKRHLSSEMI